MTTPNPESKEAIEQGCKCPVIDNHHGEGFQIGEDPTRHFWQSSDCPLHEWQANDE
jgi:hypothetical protein